MSCCARVALCSCPNTGHVRARAQSPRAWARASERGTLPPLAMERGPLPPLLVQLVRLVPRQLVARAPSRPRSM